jgi:hypothetical protein
MALQKRGTIALIELPLIAILEIISVAVGEGKSPSSTSFVPAAAKAAGIIPLCYAHE